MVPCERVKPLLVFQHVRAEHPGILRDFLRADGIPWRAVELDAGERIPDLGDFSALVVMGGPMDVWEEDLHPWLRDEKAAIREAVVERGMPVLGVCLGHQLLAEALGGEVGRAARPEVGFLEVELTEAGRRSDFLAGLPERITPLQWHGAEVKRLPAGAEALASSPVSAVQAFAVGDRALGLQFHVEITPATVGEWAVIPAYAAALEATLGAGAVARLEREAAQRMAASNRAARVVYDNFRKVTGL
jgi:GMP synthase-like glutamine amidotransferase